MNHSESYTPALRAAMVGRRVLLGWSQGQLAEALAATGDWPKGVRGASVSAIEAGAPRHLIDDRRLDSWALALGWRLSMAQVAGEVLSYQRLEAK
jgi:hypothetical protein